MIFQPLSIAGSYLIRPELLPDERGFFARTYCSEIFKQNGLNSQLRQCSISFNVARHTLRGLHYQRHPHAETKLVRCTQGTAFHVIVDLRNESESYLQWTSAKLSAENRNMIYIPQGVAHGFVTLQEATEIFYQMSESHTPKSAAGVRWDDPAFRVDWPVAIEVISERDSSYPDFPTKRSSRIRDDD